MAVSTTLLYRDTPIGARKTANFECSLFCQLPACGWLVGRIGGHEQHNRSVALGHDCEPHSWLQRRHEKPSPLLMKDWRRVVSRGRSSIQGQDEKEQRRIPLSFSRPFAFKWRFFFFFRSLFFSACLTPLVSSPSKYIAASLLVPLNHFEPFSTIISRTAP